MAILLALLVWQGWMTLRLFGPDHPWQRLLDDQPIISGRHALHLYHGFLGTHSFTSRGTFCCYDPAFQAGYPKTPVFDSGSRPAELFLLLGGGAYRPAAYKVGLAIFCALIPLLLLLAAHGAGLDRGTACLATVLGLLVWWATPCQSTLAAGDLDLLLAALAALAQAGLLIGFDRRPGLAGWIGLLLTGAVGWFAQPLLFALLLPLFLVYYFSVGARHSLVWHLSLFAGLGLALACNAFWLIDWFGYWWIRSPLPVEARLLPHRTLQTLWEAPLWGDATDRALGVALIGLAAIGVGLLNHRRERPAARLLGLGLIGLLVLALAGVAWEPLGQLGTYRLLPAALLFAVVPAAYLLVELGRLLGQWTGGAWRGAALLASPCLAFGTFALPHSVQPAQWGRGVTPLAIGLGREREELLAVLREHTTPDARILWEDRPASDRSSHWTPLLALGTERAFLGGLEPRLGIEHAHASFSDQVLAGRLIGEWSDADLESYCRRYNVGWIATWSQRAEERLRSWRTAQVVTTLHDGDGPRQLFAVRRTASYALKGSQARLLHADCQHIALADVVPNANGEAVLSLHYQSGMRVSPSRVQLEPAVDPHDPIPFVRLKMSGPVVRVTLTWEKR